VKKEEREFWYLFLQIKRETPNFKNPSKIKGYRYNKHWWARD
jgi:hypothetical protein